MFDYVSATIFHGKVEIIIVAIALRQKTVLYFWSLVIEAGREVRQVGGRFDGEIFELGLEELWNVEEDGEGEDRKKIF